MDPLTVLVRETAQNSWDARLPGVGEVQFDIEGWDLEAGEIAALRSDVFTKYSKASGLSIDQLLSRHEVFGIYITDRGTRGLGGPLEADTESPDDCYDWVNFLLNVGKARSSTQSLSGGTYGFGKTISYLVSSVNAIVVYTRTRFNGRPVSRLIASAVGDEFSYSRHLYTGRHWWGDKVANSAGSPHPVMGREADRLAARIGMRQFGYEEYGTSILILAPNFDGRTDSEAMQFIAESALWHLWPKMVALPNDSCGMAISVSYNGLNIAIPSPSERPPLQAFVDAYRAVNDPEGFTPPLGATVELIRCKRPKAEVGHLAVVPTVWRPRADVSDGADSADTDGMLPASPFPRAAHHIALLRSPRLVVCYMEGPAPVEGGTEWGGVFQVNDKYDHLFANSEPPTHDAWNVGLLEKGPGKTTVNVSLREVYRIVDALWRGAPVDERRSTDGVARVADELGHLVSSVAAAGKGQAESAGSRGGASGHSGSRVDIVWARPIVLGEAGEERAGTAARVRVSTASSSQGVLLSVNIGSALDGKEIDSDLDPALELLEFRSDSAGEPHRLDRSKYEVELASGVSEIELVVARSDDTTVMFDLGVQEL
ncbi:hypothetical protein [Williamsia serinedens]|nr:hypothetical protein [Williamsia serinedens]